jgi:hypothetical protein
MRPIFDCRETAMELCRLPSTVCERVGERWRDGAMQFCDLGYPVTKMLAHTRWRGRSMRPIFDCRETAMELCRLPSTVCERVGERWRDGAMQFCDLGVSGH